MRHNGRVAESGSTWGDRVAAPPYAWLEPVTVTLARNAGVIAHRLGCTATDPERYADRDCPVCSAYIRSIHELEQAAEDAPVRFAERGYA